MPSDRAQKHRTKLAVVLVVVAAAACFAAPLSGRAPPTTRDVLTYETDEFRYEYQLVSGRESLFENCDGTRRFVDVARVRAAETAACRRALADELGVPDLSVLRRPDPDRDAIARLRAIGYL